MKNSPASRRAALPPLASRPFAFGFSFSARGEKREKRPSSNEVGARGHSAPGLRAASLGRLHGSRLLFYTLNTHPKNFRFKALGFRHGQGAARGARTQARRVSAASASILRGARQRRGLAWALALGPPPSASHFPGARRDFFNASGAALGFRHGRGAARGALPSACYFRRAGKNAKSARPRMRSGLIGFRARSEVRRRRCQALGVSRFRQDLAHALAVCGRRTPNGVRCRAWCPKLERLAASKKLLFSVSQSIPLTSPVVRWLFRPADRTRTGGVSPALLLAPRLAAQRYLYFYSPLKGEYKNINSIGTGALSRWIDFYFSMPPHSPPKRKTRKAPVLE